MFCSDFQVFSDIAFWVDFQRKFPIFHPNFSFKITSWSRHFAPFNTAIVAKITVLLFITQCITLPLTANIISFVRRYDKPVIKTITCYLTWEIWKKLLKLIIIQNLRLIWSKFGSRHHFESFRSCLATTIPKSFSYERDATLHCQGQCRTAFWNFWVW